MGRTSPSQRAHSSKRTMTAIFLRRLSRTCAVALLLSPTTMTIVVATRVIPAYAPPLCIHGTVFAPSQVCMSTHSERSTTNGSTHGLDHHRVGETDGGHWVCCRSLSLTLCADSPAGVHTRCNLSRTIVWGRKSLR